MISEGVKGINGLVLAGGKSVRMGQDKGLTAWHGIPQRYYVADMLRSLCDEVFISCRADQVSEIDSRFLTLTDKYEGAGPAGGILTALEHDPNKAWLVVACDLPLLDMATLQFLVSNRNPATIATTFESPYDTLPEPLITIWETSSYNILLNKVNEGFKCPRKVLINNNITLLKASDPQALMNTNTPEDAASVNDILHLKMAHL